MADEPRHGGTNEAIFVKNDYQAIYFEVLGMQSYREQREKLIFEGAAELFGSCSSARYNRERRYKKSS